MLKEYIWVIPHALYVHVDASKTEQLHCLSRRKGRIFGHNSGATQ